MCPFLHDFSLMQYHYLVGTFYRTKSVSHHHYCLILKKIIQLLYNFPFIVGIKRIGGLIKKQVIRIFIDGTRYEQPLLLTLAKACTLCTYFRIETIGKAFYKR